MGEREGTSVSSRRDRDVIRQTAELLASDVPLREVFARFSALLAQVIDAPRVFIALREGPALRIAHLLIDGATGDPEQANIQAGSVSQTVATTARSVLKRTRDDWTEPLLTSRVTGSRDGPEVVSAVYVPLKFGADVIGVLSVQSTSEAAYDADDVELLETCALYLAVRVHDARQEGLNRTLAGLASRDGLTGVANRRSFDEQLADQWELCAKSGAQLAVVFVDVDYFKAFNDSYGHIAGDACLQQVAQALAACTKRPGDMLARYGGEEFVAVLPATNAADAVLVAERMRAAVEAMAIEHDGSSLGHVSISAGVAAATASIDGDVVAVVKAADEAAYRAKGDGRNRVAGPEYLSVAPSAERRVRTRHNLHLQLTRFLGRERELDDVHHILAEARLVTLAGPGGIGKTRLAIEAARTMLDAFAEVRLIDLARLGDAALIPGAVAAALELAATEATTPVELIATALRPKAALLVFDNCEHVTEGCAAFVETLLAEAPGLRVLATSREPLGITGERVYRVASLTVPPADGRVTAAKARTHDGVRFFVTRAEEAAHFVLDDDNARAVARVCRRLDGIPLAIELATARLRVMTIDDLAARLDESFRILVGKRRTTLPRQQTMRTLIDWSYSLLSAAERAIFADLAIFTGSWTLEAACVVCANGEIGEEQAIDGLTQLVDKSLVLLEHHGAANRYRFLESTHDYARERLAAGGETAHVAERYIDYYRRLAERIRAAQAEQPTRRWLPAVIPEWDNFRSILTRCLQAGGDAVTGATIVADLVPYWEAASKPGDALLWLEIAHATDGLPPELRARIELAIAFFLRTTNDDPIRTGELARRALDFAIATGDDRTLCVALVNVGGAHLMQNGTDEAVPAFEQALALARDTGDRLTESDALNNLGICADYAGDIARSQVLYEESLRIARAIGHDRKIARALHNLCAVMQDRGDLDAAVRYEREAIATIEPWGTPRQFMIDLADLELIRGNLETAGSICRDILEGLVVERSMWQVRECLFVLAQIHARAGHDERAAGLVGFMETLDSNLAPRQPTFEALYARFVDDLRACLTNDGFAHATHDGSTLTLDEAVARALQPL